MQFALLCTFYFSSLKKDDRKCLCKTLLYLNDKEWQVVEEIELFFNLFWVMKCSSFNSDYFTSVIQRLTTLSLLSLCTIFDGWGCLTRTHDFQQR